MRDQQEHGAGGRLFEPLQERIGGAEGHVLGRMDERHAQPAAVRFDVQEVGNAAHLLDFDLGARLGSQEFKNWVDNELNGYTDLATIPVTSRSLLNLDE